MRDTTWLNTLFFYYIQYEKGFLPETGGVNDQPAKFPELMTTFGHTLNEVNALVKKKK